jgi:glucose-fructose oxidoreductase
MPRRAPPVRVAVIGLGHFAQVAVLPAFAQVPHARLAAIVSRTPAKLTRLGRRYRVPHRIALDDLDRFLASGAVDAAYVAVPNDLHADVVRRVARHRLHVLCEKPMATSVAEAEGMIAACDAAGVQLMVGYRLHFEPANLRVVERVRRGAIGEPRIFAATFAMQVKPGNVRIADRPAAGPLWDIGIYCVNAARYIFGGEPIEVSARAVRTADDPRFAHVPEAIAAHLRFDHARLATFVASFGAADQARYEVIGTDGVIELDHAFDYAQPMRLREVHGGRVRQLRFGKRDQIAGELRHFVARIREGRPPEPSGREGLADVVVLEAIERSIATGAPVALPRRPAPPRPTAAQAEAAPAHGEPATVGVDAPA